MECLVQIDAWDPVAGATVTLYASSVDDDRVCHLNGVTWWPALAKLPVLGYDFFGGDFDSAQIQAPASGLNMAVEPWPNFERYIFANAAFQLWTGNAGDAWGSWTKRFSGRVAAQPHIANGIAELAFGVDARWLDAPVLTAYAGTGGAEGQSTLKGQSKPLALGAPRFVSGVMVDPINVVVQLSSYGLIEDVETAFDALTRFPASVGDFGSYAALIAPVLAPGTFATCKATGMVRHGAPLAGQQSYHVKGDKAGTDGWARLPGELIRRLAILAGGTGKINDASLDALDLARPWPVSLYVDQQTTARDLIQRLAVSVNAVAGVSWLGQLFAAAVPKPQAVNVYYGTTRPFYGTTNAMYVAVNSAVLGASQLTLQADGSDLPPVASVEQIAMDTPFWRLAIGAERTWTVHDPSQVPYTGDITPAQAYQGASKGYAGFDAAGTVAPDKVITVSLVAQSVNRPAVVQNSNTTILVNEATTAFICTLSFPSIVANLFAIFGSAKIGIDVFSLSYAATGWMDIVARVNGGSWFNLTGWGYGLGVFSANLNFTTTDNTKFLYSSNQFAVQQMAVIGSPGDNVDIGLVANVSGPYSGAQWGHQRGNLFAMELRR